MDKDEAEKKIRAAAKAGKVVFAPSDGIEQFGPLCDEFLADIFNVHAAFVSDESAISDFVPYVSDADRHADFEKIFRRIELIYAVDARKCRYIIDVLRLIHASRQNRGHS